MHVLSWNVMHETSKSIDKQLYQADKQVVTIVRTLPDHMTGTNENILLEKF